MSLQKINVNSTDLGVVHTGDIVADPQRKWEQGTAEEYIDSEVAKEKARAMTAEENLRILYNNLQQSQPIPVTALPATGETGKIYRLAGTTSYADYMYKEGALTTPIKMAEYDNAIDDKLMFRNENITTGNGIFISIIKNENKSLINAKIGKNKYDKNSPNIIHGYHIGSADGKLNPTANWCVLPVYGLKEGWNYKASGFNTSIVHVAYFNNEVFISGQPFN